MHTNKPSKNPTCPIGVHNTTPNHARHSKTISRRIARKPTKSPSVTFHTPSLMLRYDCICRLPNHHLSSILLRSLIRTLECPLRYFPAVLPLQVFSCMHVCMQVSSPRVPVLIATGLSAKLFRRCRPISCMYVRTFQPQQRVALFVELRACQLITPYRHVGRLTYFVSPWHFRNPMGA